MVTIAGSKFTTNQIFDTQNQQTGICGLLNDVTDQVRIERYRTAQYAITHILTEADFLSLCGNRHPADRYAESGMGCRTFLACRSSLANQLQCVAGWHQPEVSAQKN